MCVTLFIHIKTHSLWITEEMAMATKGVFHHRHIWGRPRGAKSSHGAPPHLCVRRRRRCLRYQVPVAIVTPYDFRTCVHRCCSIVLGVCLKSHTNYLTNRY